MGEFIDNNLEKYIVNENELLSSAVDKLCKNENKGLIVAELCDGKYKPSGLFTRRDMVKCSHVFESLNVRISSFMNPDFDYSVDRISEEDKNSFHALIPVLDKQGFLKAVYFPQNEKKRAHHTCPVVINAGGKGTRLYPYTETVPKPMVRVVDDKPMVELIIDQFNKYSITDFYMIVNHKKEIIEDYFSPGRFSYNVNFFEEKKPLGTGGGLFYLRNKINDTFFFSNCDIILLENYPEIYEYHKESHKIATMVVSLKPIHVPYGVIRTDEKQNLMSSIEKPTYMMLVNTGIYLLEPEIFSYINEDEYIEFPSVLERARSDGHQIGVYPITEDRWLDMGQIEELEHAKAVLSKRLSSGGKCG